jgi:replicative DNA helicase
MPPALRQYRDQVELLKKTYNELDDGVIESLVLLITSHLDHLKQVINEPIIKLSQLSRI